MKSLLKYIPLVLATSLIISSCGSSQSDKEAKTEEILPDNIVELNAEQAKMAGIQFGTVESRMLSTSLKVNGLITVSPRDIASVCAPLGGFVKSTDLVQGKPVHKGQTLAIMENPAFIELQQSYLESKSKLEYAEGEFTRHKELYQEDVYSAKNLQEVTSNYKGLKAQVNATGAKLGLIGIKASGLNEDNITSTVNVIAPISGYVKVVNVNTGMFVAPEAVMFEVVNTSNLTIELTLFEKDITKVEAGQKLSFNLPNDESMSYLAVISQVGKAVSADRTVKVYANVIHPSEKNLPGMFVSAILETASLLVTALPSEAIVQFDEKDYIFVFDRDKQENGKPVTEYKIIEVKKGMSDKGYTQITLPEGFDAKNTRVVIKGAYKLMSAKKNAGEMAC
jgi:cobalt-zinc-cadmium efflux system membrane fusion protein